MIGAQILVGDCLAVLPTLPAASVQCCVTSPPYWGLRDYGTATWEGGEAGCEHKPPIKNRNGRDRSGLTGSLDYVECQEPMYKDVCRCGARRIDSQLGLESTPDEYIATMVAVFREVWRVLKPDATCWINLGDSFGDKQLQGIPWRLAFALQADGWVLRSEIIWSKPNPMPESVSDRPTKAHEQIFMFAKAKWIGSIEPIRITNMDAVWMAAVIDAEGSICFQQNDRDKGPTISVRLSIVNTNKDLLERVVEICGIDGSIDAPSPRIRSNGESGRPVYSWQVTNKKAASVIAAVIPFLIAKRKQAELAIAVQILNQKHKGRGGYVTTPRDLEYKQKCMQACSSLNRTGNADLSWFKPARPGHWEPQTYVYDADAIAEPSNPDHFSRYKYDFTGANGRVICPNDSEGQRYRPDGKRNSHETRNKRTVWTVATQAYAEAHFATFPEDLIKPCILAGSRVGDTVLDPFLGSGTTARVALELGRSAIGIELNPSYAELARARANVTPGFL